MVDLTNYATAPQPPPLPGGQVVYLEAIRDLRARAEMGKKKYGTYLKTDDGRDAPIDLYQELMDVLCYWKKFLLERAAKERRVMSYADQSTMGKCKDCEHWEREAERTCGYCRRLDTCNSRLFLTPPDDGFVVTPETFGCNEFKAKSKGPFKVRPYGDHYDIQHIKTGHTFGDWESLIHAARHCDWLNELWERRE